MTSRPRLLPALIACLAVLLAAAGAANARVLNGTARANTLVGTPGADVVRGFGGDDRLLGFGGDDVLVGGAGRDRLVGGAGRDRLVAGPGDDEVLARDGRRDVVSCGAGRDRALVDGLDQVARDCENVRGRPLAPRPVTPPPPASPPPPAPPPAPPPPTNPIGSVPLTFSGDLVTTIQYLSFCGPGGRIETTRIPSTVTVTPPVSSLPLEPGFPPAAGRDANPIALTIGQTSVAANIAPGSVRLRSAERFGATSPPLVLQYWNLTLTGAAITGTLTQSNAAQAAAANLLSATTDLIACMPQFGSYPNQEPIAAGATLTGTLTATEVRLRIVGNTINGIRPFVTEITATRAP